MSQTEMATYAYSKTSKPLSKLELLPEEIIDHIATLCGADAVIALSSASKILYRICNTSSIFQKIVVHTICDYDPAGKDAYRTRNFKLDVLSEMLGQDRWKWQAYAMALDRAIGLENKLSGIQASPVAETPHALSKADELSEYISYMPQLLCLGYRPLEEVHIAVHSCFNFLVSKLGLTPAAESQYACFGIYEHHLLFCLVLEAWQYLQITTTGDPTAAMVGRIYQELRAKPGKCPAEVVFVFKTRAGLETAWQETRRSQPPDLWQYPWLYAYPRWMQPLCRMPLASRWRPGPILHVMKGADSIVPSLFLDEDDNISEWRGYHSFDENSLSLSVLRRFKPKLERGNRDGRYTISAERVRILNGAPRSTHIRYTAVGDISEWNGNITVSFRFFEGQREDLQLKGSLTPFGLIGEAFSRNKRGNFWLWKKSWRKIPLMSH